MLFLKGKPSLVRREVSGLTFPFLLPPPSQQPVNLLLVSKFLYLPVSRNGYAVNVQAGNKDQTPSPKRQGQQQSNDRPSTQRRRSLNRQIQSIHLGQRGPQKPFAKRAVQRPKFTGATGEPFGKREPAAFASGATRDRVKTQAPLRRQRLLSHNSLPAAKRENNRAPLYGRTTFRC